MPITIDLLDEAHAQVAPTILTADGNQPVYSDAVPDSPPPEYVLVRTSVSWPDATDGKSFDGTTSTCVTRWFTYSVGPNSQSARSINNRVRQLLVNVHPTITGRSCGFIQQDPLDIPPDFNETAGGLVVTLREQYTLTTYPG